MCWHDDLTLCNRLLCCFAVVKAARLVDHCLAQGSRDNMSVMIVDLNSKFKLGDRPVYVAPDGEHSEGEGIPLGGAFTTGGDSSNNSADSQSDAAEQK